ncbi:hypothetical protein D6T64_16435 [Cryobacterium melibiosiphilum]|uniref:Uncharacterized protein n=1 Tax=Cryobacterium melibiosiphilum TaxID=995039 RepID=A0A3A5MLS3_9MICO|nr:hypothetical protein [Cryobacterium melibiosiphilum]RJT87026.1 hypothetical protein D6T64_16435 [Cryobacterium melibiosiphilum]
MVDASQFARLLPLEFQQPPRWPAPTGDWVAGHLGWEPAPGWTPTPDCPPAPPGWVFWRRNEGAWEQYAHSYTAPARRSIWIGLLVLALGVIVTTGLYSLSAPIGLFVVFWAAMLWGPILIIRAGRRMDKVNAALMDNLRENAPRVKVELDRLAYEAYLRSFRASS